MNAQIISFNCLLTNKAGKFISSTFNREVLNSTEVQGAQLAGLARGLQNLKKGEKRTINLAAEEAYGLYDPTKVVFFPKKALSTQNVRIGESVTIITKSGAHRSYVVTQIFPDMVGLDGNHPLAGQDLIFEIEALDAREATRAEIDESLNPTSTQLLH